MTTATFRFALPSHPRYLAVVRAVVGELGSVCGLPAEECRGMILAVDEALANVIRHAYLGRFDREIEVCCQAHLDHLEFTLLDHGIPPDPERLLPHPLDEVALSGRGTFIIRSMMDEVIYEQAPGGNQVRLIKRLPVALGKAGEEGKT